MPSASSRTRSTSARRNSKMPSSQRPFFLSSFLAAFRQQTPSGGSLSAPSQSSKSHTHSQSSASATASSSASGVSPGGPSSASPSQQLSSPQQGRSGNGVMNQLPLHSPRTHGGIPIPGGGSPGRRRGSDSSSEGFRDVMGGEKWYIGGRTAGGEEKYFKLGVVRRIKSQDRLSLDRLSL